MRGFGVLQNARRMYCISDRHGKLTNKMRPAARLASSSNVRCPTTASIKKGQPAPKADVGPVLTAANQRLGMRAMPARA